MAGKIYNGRPTQRRGISTSLGTFHASNSHIDLLAFAYEVITEKTEKVEVFDLEIEEDEVLYNTKESILRQLGVEKYTEFLFFLQQLKQKYVTDFRNSKAKVAAAKTLVFFDENGEVTIEYEFDALFILKELNTFFVPDFVIQKHLKNKKKRNEFKW